MKRVQVYIPLLALRDATRTAATCAGALGESTRAILRLGDNTLTIFASDNFVASRERLPFIPECDETADILVSADELAKAVRERAKRIRTEQSIPVWFSEDGVTLDDGTVIEAREGIVPNIPGLFKSRAAAAANAEAILYLAPKTLGKVGGVLAKRDDRSVQMTQVGKHTLSFHTGNLDLMLACRLH